ncbi:hypothetical protein AAG593_04205 [Citromicrobium bathyomarinum]
MGAIRLSSAIRWALLGLALFCALALLWLVLSAALDKEVSIWAKGILVIVGVAAAIATALSSDFKMRQDGGVIQSLTSPRTIAIIFVAIFATFGVMTDALQLFLPRPAVESAPGIIEDTTRDTNERLRQLAPDRPAIATRVPGRWGETAECDVAYEVTIKDKGIQIKRDAQALPEYTMVGTIKAETADTLTVAVREPKNAAGQMLDLRLEDDGMTRRLVWDEVGMDVPLKLHPCGEVH